MTLPETNAQILLASRPRGAATLDNFRLVEAEMPALADGEVRVRHQWLSIDPYMRGRMNDAKSYAAPQALDAVMIGQTVGVVVESRSPQWAVGDAVVHMGGWQQYSVVAGDDRRGLRKIDTTVVPASAYLGAVGMPGVTAWYGLMKLIAPKPGETVVVSAAAGAVGSAVGQLAKARGLRAVGIAGGPEKCAWVQSIGFDACIDHRAHPDARALGSALREACPDGVDGYFENVGGAILDAVLGRMNAFGRIALCGMIAGYDGAPIPLAQPHLLLSSRLRVEGFIVTEHPEVWPEALAELAGRVADGSLRYRESIAVGLAEAPAALLGVLAGKNVGKQLVSLG
ncbi:MAG: NADP-dependent oxidoreductase [Myxococcales bacterium]|nr:NADP-dependent oxidoreductase [Myxococcales bacterium]